MVHHRRAKRLLSWNADEVPAGGAATYSTLTALTHSFPKEPAGHCFHNFALKQSNLYDEPSQADSTDEDDASDSTSARGMSAADLAALDEEASKTEGATWRDFFFGDKKKSKRKKKDKRLDLYALLGLQHERWMASAEQIKASYKKAALTNHPDKAPEEEREAAEEIFKKIQDAYETLSDPSKRREFDSTDDFDDSLPIDCSSADFYKVFGAAFRRNSRWSVNQPVPDVGDDTTSLQQVDAFYDFWFGFKSWREFPHPDEEDAENAESREERRWIERYNSKLREKNKKEDKQRIREFVERAQKLDPRIVKRKELELAAKEAKKKQKEEERLRKVREEEERLAAEAKKKAEEEVAAAEARKARQHEKKALQRERARLRKLVGISGDGSTMRFDIKDSIFSDDDIELICAQMELINLQSLCDTIDSGNISPTDKTAAISDSLDSVRDKLDGSAREKEKQAAAVASALEKSAAEDHAARIAKLEEWSDEEVRLLKKGLEKFPPGTMKRWEQVQAYLRTRTIEEILDMTKHGLTSKLAILGGKEKGFTIVQKRQANRVIKSEATSRVESFSDVEVNLRGEAVKLMAGGNFANGDSNGNGVAVVEKEEKGSAAAVAVAPPAAAPTPLTTVTSGLWTEAQELALVQALKTVPKDASDRWDQVAAAVEGRSKVECMKRFKELKASFKAKKG